MYEGVIYFAGPKSRWSGSVDEGDIIARTGRTPWRWHARFLMMNTFTALDRTRCGYALMRGDEAIEQFDPPLPEIHS